MLKGWAGVIPFAVIEHICQAWLERSQLAPAAPVEVKYGQHALRLAVNH